MILPMLLNRTKLLPVYVTGIGESKNQRRIVRPCGFQSYHILYCKDGKGILKIENKEYEIGRGDVFFFRPDIPHEYYPTEEPWQTRWVIFSGNSISDIIDYMDFGNSEVFSLPSLTDFDLQINALSDMFWCSDLNKEIKTSMLMYKLLIKMDEYRNRTQNSGGMTKHEKYEKLSPVIDMLNTNYHQDLSLEDMANVIGVTTNHLCRLFNQVYGITPLKYLTQLRLNMAKHYLSSPQIMRIKDIAPAVGFKDTSYFISVFKKTEGMTPDEFRRINSF